MILTPIFSHCLHFSVFIDFYFTSYVKISLTGCVFFVVTRKMSKYAAHVWMEIEWISFPRHLLSAITPTLCVLYVAFLLNVAGMSCVCAFVCLRVCVKLCLYFLLSIINCSPKSMYHITNCFVFRVQKMLRKRFM